MSHLSNIKSSICMCIVYFLVELDVLIAKWPRKPIFGWAKQPNTCRTMFSDSSQNSCALQSGNKWWTKLITLRHVLFSCKTSLKDFKLCSFLLIQSWNDKTCLITLNSGHNTAQNIARQMFRSTTVAGQIWCLTLSRSTHATKMTLWLDSTQILAVSGYKFSYG